MIERLIHRIWVGSSLPEDLAAYGRTWVEHHPDWEHVLWTDETMPRLRNQRLYDNAETIAPNHVGQFRADIARYELLSLFGGVYVDCDFECRKPIDALLVDVEAFAIWERTGQWVANGLMGATVGHPFVERLIRGLPANVARKAGSRPNKLSGPQYLTRVWRADFRDTVAVLPKAWFLPYLWDELDRAGEDFPEAYAVHHWHNRRREIATGLV